MKHSKGSQSNQHSGYQGVSHRQSASSVGKNLKSRAGGQGGQSAANANESNTGASQNQERTGYHQSGTTKASGQASKASGYKQTSANTVGAASASNTVATTGGGQERKCDNCDYRTPLNQCTTFRCRNCGTYIICEYCYEEYMEKGGYYEDSASSKKIQCVYCWSRHTLTDICVKTLKSLGFLPVKGSNKIQISNLTRDKIKKLSNLRVIQKTLVYVIGIAPEIASEEKLKSVQYFGQYGNLQKVVVNTKDVYNATRGGPSYSAYLTFHSARESAIAILSVDQYVLNDRMIRASFGTSKFCQFFLNNQKCNNKDCLYLHELRADLEAYTKEDMQNNKFIFLEQQKIAIKLSKALDLSKEQFNRYNLERNEALRVATDKAQKSGIPIKPVLPEPSYIYHKDFHFLDEPLIERQHKREQALAAKSAAAKQAASSSAGEIDSASTAATNATAHSSQSAATVTASSTQGVAANKQNVVGKITVSKLKGAASETNEESKNSEMPIFTNQKDIMNQVRKQSQLRTPASKGQTKESGRDVGGVQTDSSSAKNSQSNNSNYNSATNSAINSDTRVNETPSSNTSTQTANQAQTNSAKAGADNTQGGASGGSKTGILFPFEPFTKQQPPVAVSEASGPSTTDPITNLSTDEHLNILSKQSNQTGTTIFQSLLNSQMAHQAAQNEKISNASAAAAERFRKKEMNQKKKKKIIVEHRDQVSSTPIEQANITKVDTASLATHTSPVKLNNDKVAQATTQATHAPPATNSTSNSASGKGAPSSLEDSTKLSQAQAVIGQAQTAQSAAQSAKSNNLAAGISREKRNPSSGVKAAITPAQDSTKTTQPQTASQDNQGQINASGLGVHSKKVPNPSQTVVKQVGASSSQPPNKQLATSNSASVTLANNRVQSGANIGDHRNDLIQSNSVKDKANMAEVGSKNPKKQEFMQTQTVSLSSFNKKHVVSSKGDGDANSEQSPTLQYGRNQSRFQFAHSVDPVKKEIGFKFGFGMASSEVDKDEILVPMKVQELIHRSIRTLSNSISNRSPDEAAYPTRDASNELVPVEEIEPELEQKWYTMEEKAQEEIMASNNENGRSPTFEESKGGSVLDGSQPSLSNTNPFRMLHNKKDKEPQHVVGSNLDVKRVKYSYKQTSPSGEEKYATSELEEQKMVAGQPRPATSPFQPSGGAQTTVSKQDGNARFNKAGHRRAGPQAERGIRQPPNNR